MNTIERFYDQTVEGEWQRLLVHKIEYGLTMKALQEFLPPAPARIADVGGATGRYAIELARAGYTVTLVDLSKENLKFAQARAAETGVQLAGYHHADARDLSLLSDRQFDAVLLMGPMYHLLTVEDRAQAISEARRILRAHGRVFAAFMSRYSVLQIMPYYDPTYIVNHRSELDRILSTGVYQPSDSPLAWTDVWFAHPTEIAPIMQAAGFSQNRLIATEALMHGQEGPINALPDDLHQQWIDLLYTLADDPCLLGACGHLLYIGEKTDA